MPCTDGWRGLGPTPYTSPGHGISGKVGTPTCTSVIRELFIVCLLTYLRACFLAYLLPLRYCQPSSLFGVSGLDWTRTCSSVKGFEESLEKKEELDPNLNSTFFSRSLTEPSSPKRTPALFTLSSLPSVTSFENGGPV